MRHLAAVETRLEEQLAEPHGMQARVETDLAEPLNADSSEQAVEMEDDAALEGQDALIDNQIVSVSRALERIEKGTYGECVRCGGHIAAARLDVRPEAAICIASARDRQSGVEVKRWSDSVESR